MITCLSQLLIHFWFYWNQLLGAMIWKISNAPNYEIEMFWKCSFGTCFRIFCESLRVFVFGSFTKWIIVFPSGLAVEYFHRVDVDEFNLEQNWKSVWIWGFFKDFEIRSRMKTSFICCQLKITTSLFKQELVPFL